jgi:DNA-binding PadR family transcriptional regulator
MAHETLGHLEQLVLLAILRLGNRSYGVPILEEIRTRTGREYLRPSVYIALRRLEAKGLVKSRLGDPTPERGGRAKRFFALTAPGHRQLEQSRADLRRMWPKAARARQART